MDTEKIDTEQYLQEFNMSMATHGNRQTTNVSLLLQFLIGLVLTAGVCGIAFAFRGNYVSAVVLERGPVQFLELYMAGMVAVFIALKFRALRAQGKIIQKGPVDYDVDLSDDLQVQELRDRIMYDDHFGKSIVLDQIHHILTLWLVSKDAARVSDWFDKEAETSQSASESTYALTGVLIWAIPIMGFIGTVMGLGGAVSGFSDFLSGAAELSAIKDAIGNVTVGLGVAFDTTLLALVLCVILMFPLSFAQRKESLFFVDLGNYLQDSLLSRFPSTEQAKIEIANLDGAIDAGFRRYVAAPEQYEAVFSQAIKQAGGEVEKQFSELADRYEKTVSSLDMQWAGTMTKSAEAMERMFQNAVVATQQLTEKLDEVARLSENIQQVLQVEQTMAKGLESISAGSEFSETLKKMQEHLEATDAFCRTLSKPRVITWKEETV